MHKPGKLLPHQLIIISAQSTSEHPNTLDTLTLNPDGYLPLHRNNNHRTRLDNDNLGWLTIESYVWSGQQIHITHHETRGGGVYHYSADSIIQPCRDHEQGRLDVFIHP